MKTSTIYLLSSIALLSGCQEESAYLKQDPLSELNRPVPPPEPIPGAGSEPTLMDSDGDGINDSQDAFPNDPTETVDTDSDGTGNNQDAFPNDPTETADTDGDGTGNNQDVFPNDPTETVDTDGDGIGDNQDPSPQQPGENDGGPYDGETCTFI